MHIVMRSHPNTEVADILVRHKGEIERLDPWNTRDSSVGR